VPPAAIKRCPLRLGKGASPTAFTIYERLGFRDLDSVETMPPKIRYARDPSATRRILESLPAWFGNPEAIDNYEIAAASEDFTSVLAIASDETIGVALVRRHFPEAAELHLIAVSPDTRGQGIGRALADRIATDLAEDGCVLLSVHTVGPSFDSQPYAQTRGFYHAMGFVPLEEHRGIDWAGPTLILVRDLR
jgi:ribosomal protein S18 acetylase RimI-like enzyme